MVKDLVSVLMGIGLTKTNTKMSKSDECGYPYKNLSPGSLTSHTLPRLRKTVRSGGGAQSGITFLTTSCTK